VIGGRTPDCLRRDRGRNQQTSYLCIHVEYDTQLEAQDAEVGFWELTERLQAAECPMIGVGSPALVDPRTNPDDEGRNGRTHLSVLLKRDTMARRYTIRRLSI
jgi:hypothetical protein